MKSDEGRKVIVCNQIKIMHEMFKFNFKSISPNIYVPNHISNVKTMFSTHKIIIDNEHLVFFHGKNDTKKNLRLLGFKIKVKNVYIATQINEPSSCCIWAFVNRPFINP